MRAPEGNDFVVENDGGAPKGNQNAKGNPVFDGGDSDDQGDQGE